MKLIKLECVLMDNGEILFLGKSLGFIQNKGLEKYIEVIEEL